MIPIWYSPESFCHHLRFERVEGNALVNPSAGWLRAFMALPLGSVSGLPLPLT
jgi:hypothetical protein